MKFADAVKLIDASPESVMNVKLFVRVLLIVAFSAFVSTKGFRTFENVALFTNTPIPPVMLMPIVELAKVLSVMVTFCESLSRDMPT